MNLITKADDERLKVGGIGGTDPNYLLRDSLRVVIAERDAALQVALTKCPVCGSETAGSNESVINKQLFRVRADLAAALAQLADEKQKVANLEEYMLKGVAFRDELQTRVKELGKLIDAGRELFDSLGSISTHHTGGVCVTGLEREWVIKKLFTDYRTALSIFVSVKENANADRRPA